MSTKIYCCGCERKINARLTNGKEIYPHRKDLFKLPFYKCDKCGNYVGTHHKSKDRLKPLGSIPTPEIRELRKQIHKEIDWLWRDTDMSRGEVYSAMSEAIGREFHSAEVSSVDEANMILNIAMRPFDKWNDGAKV